MREAILRAKFGKFFRRPRILHSQTVRTRQPSSRSDRRTRLSLAVLSVIFLRQNSSLVRGQRNSLQL